MTGSQEQQRRQRLPPGRHGLPRELIARSQRERLLAAMVRVTAARGYSATSVADVLRAARVGRETFYELFKDRHDCFLAAHRLLCEELFEFVSERYRRPGPWPERVRNGLDALLAWLAADADAAKVVVVEPGGVGPVSRERCAKTYSAFVSLLDEGRDASGAASSLPRISDLAAGAVLARIYEEVVLGRAAELPLLLPDLTYEVLVPFLGEEAARAEQAKAAARRP